MLADLAIPSLQNCATCTPAGFQCRTKRGLINKYKRTDASSIFIENVLDIANTLAQVMTICDIHQCKAKSAVDVVIDTFLHYERGCSCGHGVPDKIVRKEDLLRDFSNKCLMTPREAYLAYKIVKYGFNAFYYIPKDNYNDKHTRVLEECAYARASEKMVDMYLSISDAVSDDLSCESSCDYEIKIKVTLKNFYDRMRDRLNTPHDEDCDCCKCAEELNAEGKPSCPLGCKLSRTTLMRSSHLMAKCPRCQRTRKFCHCMINKYGLEWATSFWNQPEASEYYKDRVGGEFKPGVVGYCADWFDPIRVRHMASRGKAMDATCADWFKPVWVKPFDIFNC